MEYSQDAVRNVAADYFEGASEEPLHTLAYLIILDAAEVSEDVETFVNTVEETLAERERHNCHFTSEIAHMCYQIIRYHGWSETIGETVCRKLLHEQSLENQ